MDNDELFPFEEENYEGTQIIQGLIYEKNEEDQEVEVIRADTGLPLIIDAPNPELLTNISVGNIYYLEVGKYVCEISEEQRDLLHEIVSDAEINGDKLSEKIDTLTNFILSEVYTSKPVIVEKELNEIEKAEGLLLFPDISTMYQIRNGQLIRKLLSVYRKIVVGPAMSGIIEDFVPNKERKKLKDENRLEELDEDYFLNIYGNIRPKIDDEEKSVLPYLVMCLEKDFFIHLPIKLYEDAISVLKEEKLDEYIPVIKRRLKHRLACSFVFGESVPDFNIENFGQLKDYLKITEKHQKHLNEWIASLVDEFGGYKLQDKEKEKIKKKISKGKEKLSNVGINILEDDEKSILLDILSMPLQIPISTILDGVNLIIKNKEVKNQNLEPIVYLTGLRGFQSESEESIGKCPICNLSKAEIEDLSEEEAHDLVHSSSFCEGHMILYLNIRKYTQAMGRNLLKMMKEYEENEELRMGAGLGGEFL